MSERRVRVRRSGGFAGLSLERVVDLEADPAGAEVAALLERVDLAAHATDEPAQPDRYVYDVEADGVRVQVPEQALTPELAELVETVLRRGVQS